MSTPASPVRHLLRDDDLSPGEQAHVLALAKKLKVEPFSARPLEGPRCVAVLSDKPTLRTQASFAAGVAELGGSAMVLDARLAGIGEREPVADTARVLDRQAALVVWRTHDQRRIEEMAANSTVPVVNGLTDRFHPCQLLADLQTIEEHKGGPVGLRLTFLGDGASNMAHSYLLAGAAAGMHVRVCTPQGYEPDPEVLTAARRTAARTGGSATVCTDPREACEGADVVATDTWVSMGKETESERRGRSFTAYRLDAALLAHADEEAIVLHCLPAHRGQEISAEVLDGPRSVVWDEAENRRHAQKALLCFLLGTQTGGLDD